MAPVTPAAKAAPPSIVEYDFTDCDDSGAQGHEIALPVADEAEATAPTAFATDGGWFADFARRIAQAAS